jgi:hypothetical protein
VGLKRRARHWLWWERHSHIRSDWNREPSFRTTRLRRNNFVLKPQTIVTYSHCSLPTFISVLFSVTPTVILHRDRWRTLAPAMATGQFPQCNRRSVGRYAASLQAVPKISNKHRADLAENTACCTQTPRMGSGIDHVTLIWTNFLLYRVVYYLRFYTVDYIESRTTCSTNYWFLPYPFRPYMIIDHPQWYKAKAVPLHATKTLKLRGIAPTHSRPRH